MNSFLPVSNVPQRLSEVIAALLLVLLSAAVVAAPPPLGHALTEVAPPLAAADFALPDIDGENHALSDYRGRVVMLNFWATWCPPCRREMPSMQRLYDKYRERGLVVVAVNQWEDPDLVFEFTGRLSVDPTFPILFDRESRVAEDYGVKGLPTTFLIDKDGQIRFRAIGGREFDHPDVEAIIEALL
ncbi:MAG: TlpA family protein disulfide reductase [Gammaproteobacteria bacterium]|nr:TlpA family protein disulfide reductase [Gammaproteobacteria bacterium]